MLDSVLGSALPRSWFWYWLTHGMVCDITLGSAATCFACMTGWLLSYLTCAAQTEGIRYSMAHHHHAAQAGLCALLCGWGAKTPLFFLFFLLASCLCAGTPQAQAGDSGPFMQNWVSYMAPMRDRGQFKHATALGSLIMTACFLALGAIGYHKLGTHFDQTQPITTALPNDAVWTPIMNTGLLAHCILAYQVRPCVCSLRHAGEPRQQRSGECSCRMPAAGSPCMTGLSLQGQPS